ncbi:ferritin-like domain-containing protein [Cereibacter sphaeroides]|uniref:YciE/YciF ferroxidase family protein n=1 Tax=Rhodobacterales TaxID=204455 RepID=UPI000BBE89E3|nr:MULTISPECIES: ferritin-like domain-containing protein [Paracoccaceae]MCE6953019.1 ferritin-like domain-containing protein [Cereibacter sphaeroides]MCE6961882.1 ferritin-like domain-containing protein [Cereibacter sphaeroides]MCE6975747.1 ferritin-like domain-containing protein [Cereibacter sphaeroides]
MALFSKDIQSMDDLYTHMLQDIYYAEMQIEKALPKMIAKASDAALRQGFESHLVETRGHVERLEQVFSLLGQTPKGATCPAIDGIIQEANDVAGDIADANVLDAALAAAAQAVEHYEMTRYGTLIAWSKELGRSDVAQILDQTLTEEKAADMKLTQLAEARLNRAA